MNLARKIISPSYPFFKYLVRDVKGLLGLDKNFFRSARGSRIIIYHGICRSDPTKFNSLFITERTFESHLQFYKRYFNVVSLDDFFEQRFSNDQFNLCLSFDDGFANNHKYVLPLLEKYKIPATFFITGIRQAGYDILWNDFLSLALSDSPERRRLKEKLREGAFDVKKKFMEDHSSGLAFKNNEELKDYWLQMTQDQINELAASKYVTIGSHGYYHNDLANLSREELVFELKASKEYLEGIIQKPVSSIAFPYGSYSKLVLEESMNAGYKQLLTTEFNDKESKFNIQLKERMGINPYISTRNQMIANILGDYK